MSYNFDLTMETRSTIGSNGLPNYNIKGYAQVPDHPYAYKWYKDGTSFKEMFSEEGCANLKRKLGSTKIFVDVEHELGNLNNSKYWLDEIKKKSGADISTEAAEILKAQKHGDLPIAKFNSCIIDDKGLLVDTSLNPLYREVDESHQKYFDACWGSLKEGYLNKMSINYKATKTHNERINGEAVPKIDDVEIFGISYTQSGANDMCDITEVVMRSAAEVSDEVKRMEENMKKENEELKAKLAGIESEQAEVAKKAEEEAAKKAEEVKANEAKTIEEQKAAIEKEKADLETLKAEQEKRLEELKAAGDKGSSGLVKTEGAGAEGAETGEKTVKQVMEILPEINKPKSGSLIHKWGFYQNPATRPNMDGKADFGELFTAQAYSGAIDYMHPDTKANAGRSPKDIVVYQGNVKDRM